MCLFLKTGQILFFVLTLVQVVMFEDKQIL